MHVGSVVYACSLDTCKAINLVGRDILFSKLLNKYLPDHFH